MIRLAYYEKKNDRVGEEGREGKHSVRPRAPIIALLNGRRLRLQLLAIYFYYPVDGSAAGKQQCRRSLVDDM